MIELLSLHVPDGRRCRLVSPLRPFPGSDCSEAIGVVQRILWMLNLGYACADAMDLLRAQRESACDLSCTAIVLWDHGLAIEASTDLTALTGTDVQRVGTPDDAWSVMYMIAAHCDVDMPQFAFRPM